MKLNTLTILLALVLVANHGSANPSSERINELAKAARKQSWVLPTDCQQEQDAIWTFRAKYMPMQYKSSGAEDPRIIETLEHPWVYRWGGKEDPRGLMTANEMRKQAVSLIKHAEETESKGDAHARVYSGWHEDAKFYRLQACAYRIAAIKREGGTSAVQPVSTAKAESQCAPEAISTLNRKLQDIDQRLATFLESAVGQQTGVSTPSLQAVMWGTSEQAKVMKQYCSGDGEFQQEIDDRMASFAAAQKACRKIQSNPDICRPVEPEKIIENYK